MDKRNADHLTGETTLGAAVSAGPDARTEARHGRRVLPEWLSAVAVFAVTLFTYIPAVHGGFLLDDDRLLTANPLIRDPNGWWRFWCTTATPDYLPLMSDTFWGEWRLWGMNTAGYHVTNIALHCTSAVLVGLVLRKLRVPGAWLAALLFGIHPVNVRSVAWISELKNTQSMVLYLTSILAWLHYDDSKDRRVYWLSAILFCCGLLSKSSVIVLPAVLLLLTWYRRGALNKAALASLIPFFLLSMAAAVTTIWYQYNRSIDPAMPVRDPIIWRLASAGFSFWFYLSKLLDPNHLAMIYPRWRISVNDPVAFVPVFLVVACLALLYVARHTRAKPVFVAYLYFLIALSPVLGFVNMAFYYSSMVSDHLQYIAMIGMMALAAAGFSTIHRRARGLGRLALTLAGFICVVALVQTSQAQARLYQSRLTLAQDTLLTNPDSFWALGELGSAELSARNYPEAERAFLGAIRVAPHVMTNYSNLGVVYYKERRYHEALALFDHANQIKPNDPDVLINLAATYISIGDLPDAARVLGQIARLRPHDSTAARELSSVAKAMAHKESPLPASRAIHGSM